MEKYEVMGVAKPSTALAAARLVTLSASALFRGQTDCAYLISSPRHDTPNPASLRSTCRQATTTTPGALVIFLSSSALHSPWTSGPVWYARTLSRTRTASRHNPEHTVTAPKIYCQAVARDLREDEKRDVEGQPRRCLWNPQELDEG